MISPSSRSEIIGAQLQLDARTFQPIGGFAPAAPRAFESQGPLLPLLTQKGISSRCTDPRRSCPPSLPFMLSINALTCGSSYAFLHPKYTIEVIFYPKFNKLLHSCGLPAGGVSSKIRWPPDGQALFIYQGCPPAPELFSVEFPRKENADFLPLIHLYDLPQK